MQTGDHRITDEVGLEAVLGAPLDFVRSKVLSGLNEMMRAFIARSPLIFVSTIDAQGRVDVSPKGDPEGFVRIDASGNLLIPERPGNKLAFGFRNILRNGEIGLIFLVPGQRETLRVKGSATLHADPATLREMQVGGKPALLYTHVDVRECFFHCGKAVIRSQLWQPAGRGVDEPSIAARQFTDRPPASGEALRQTEVALEQAYRDELY